MKLVDYRCGYDLVPASFFRPRERLGHVLRAWLLVMTVLFTAALLWVGPVRNATAQTTQTIPATIEYQSAGLCNGVPTILFVSIAADIACLTQTAIDNNYLFRFTGNYSLESPYPDVWCADSVDYANGLDQPSTGTTPCRTQISAFGVCPPGYYKNTPADYNQSNSTCYITLVSNDQTQKPACSMCVGNPIYPGTGNKQQIESDYTGSGPTALTFQRFYNSNPQFGGGWRHSYDKQLDKYSNSVLATRPEGNISFTYNGSAWVPDADVNFGLQPGI